MLRSLLRGRGGLQQMRSCVADRCVQAERHLARAWSGIFHRELCSTTHEEKPASVEAAAWNLPACSAAHLQQQPRWPLPPRLLARQSAGPFAAVDTSIDFMLWPTAARPLGWSLPPVAVFPTTEEDSRPAPMEAASVKRKRLKKMNRHKQRKLRRRERNKS